MFKLNHGVKVVKQFPTGQVFAKDVLVKIPRSGESRYLLEEEWANKLGCCVGNHTTYECVTEAGYTMYITCSDNMYYVGLSLEELR